MVPVAPVTAQLAASTPEMGCGESVDLKWRTADAVDTSISNIGPVPGDGDWPVSPDQDHDV